MTNRPEALDGENAFELFTWIMNDPQWPARILPFSCATSFSRARCANFAAPVVQAATALIADTATERGLEVAAE
jgi:hypothetical protein